MGKSNINIYKSPFSIAMLNYQRVLKALLTRAISKYYSQLPDPRSAEPLPAVRKSQMSWRMTEWIGCCFLRNKEGYNWQQEFETILWILWGYKMDIIWSHKGDIWMDCGIDTNLYRVWWEKWGWKGNKGGIRHFFRLTLVMFKIYGNLSECV